MDIASSLLDLLFPSRCAGCRSHMPQGEAICEPCFAKIGTHAGFFCGACRARRMGARRVCHPRFPYLLAAACEYRDPAVTNLIRALKFRGNARAAEPLARLVAGYLESLPLVLRLFTVVPLQLSARRERERGFNQSLLIAKKIAERFSLPLAEGALVRTRHSRPQSETKGADARRDNVAGCFSVADASPIAGRNIILVDDVVTSGATFLEAAEALKGAGARRIVALAAAKA